MGIKINLSKWASILIFIGLVSACAVIPVPKPDVTNPIHTVAILPFANESNNIEAPNQLRDLLGKKLTAKFYKVLPVTEIDQVLLDDLGITLGGQLSEVELKEIKTRISADAYIYGNITHYDQVTSGVLNTNRVRAELKMIQGSNETVFWSSNLGIKSESKSGDMLGSLASLASAISDNQNDGIRWITIKQKTGGDGSILGNLVSGMVDKAMSSAFGTTLTEESVALVNYATRTLRNGPGI